MKIYVTEKPIAHKKWTIEIHTDRFGNKFVKAKMETIYGSLLEVGVVKHDGFDIPKEKNNQLIDTSELYELKDAMMKILATERSNNYEDLQIRVYI